MNRDPQVHSAPVGDSSVQTVVRLAENELQALLKQQATIALRIQHVKKTLAGLSIVFGSDVLSDDTLRLLSPQSSTRKRGLTNACRQIILEAGRPLRSVDICALLAEQEPEVLKNHRSPAASVATIMKRLCAYGEARAILTPTGQRAWESSGRQSFEQSSLVAEEEEV